MESGHPKFCPEILYSSKAHAYIMIYSPTKGNSPRHWERFELVIGVCLCLALLRLCIAGGALFHVVPSPVVAAPWALQGWIAFACGGYGVLGARRSRKLWTAALGAFLEQAVHIALAVVVETYLVRAMLAEPSPGHPTNTYWRWLSGCMTANIVLGALELALQLYAVVGLAHARGDCCSCRRRRGGSGVVDGAGESPGAINDAESAPAAGAMGEVEAHYALLEDVATASTNDDNAAGLLPASPYERGQAAHRARRSRACCVSVWAGFGFFTVLVVTAVVAACRMFASEPGWGGTGGSPPDQSASATGSPCDPLVTAACALPYPSDFFTRADPATPTGKRLAFGADALPPTRWGTIDPARWNENDGFSTVAPLLFGFARNASLANLVRWPDIGASVDKAHYATTLLIDAETGERVAHFVDRDSYDLAFGHPAGEPSLLVLQPAQPLKHATRYVVGVRNLLTADEPTRLLRASPAFAALRDGDAEAQRRAGISVARAQHFKDHVFPVLEKAGVVVASSTLQLAWDFTTVSRDNSHGRMERMMDVAMALVGDGADGGPSDFTVDDVVEADDKMCDPSFRLQHDGEDAGGYTEGWGIRRTVWGHFSSPNFLVKPGPGIRTFLTRSSDPAAATGGRPDPVRNGVARVNFVVRVPCSLADGHGPAELAMQYGHGLFGSRDEVTDGYLNAMANRYKWVLFATDWNGMSQYDVLNALRVFLLEASEFAAVPERTMQGFVDNAVMLRLLRGRLAHASDAKLVDALGAPLLRPATAESPATRAGY